MPHACTISCPACKQSVQVWVTGEFICADCGHPFEVGVYSPPPDQQTAAIPTSSDIQFTADSLQLGNRSYRLTDLVGTNLSRDDRPGRLWFASLSVIIALIAAGTDQPLLFIGFSLFAVSAGRSWWTVRRRYVVSWITRQGHEGRLRLSNHAEAQAILSDLRERLAYQPQVRVPAALPAEVDSRASAGSVIERHAGIPVCGFPLG
jgi:hypothetical protein